MSLTAGTRLGPYEILVPIGAGGMGEVYKAKDTRLDRTVAIKVLPEHFAESPERKARFEREAKAISQLNHPHICTLYDIGSEEGLDYLVMEYLEGEMLEARLHQGPLPLEELVDIGGEIAEAVSAAHEIDIIHRDLKPGNVILTKSGTKVVDFGLAREVAPEGSVDTEAATAPALTQEGALVGTIPFMAPEQLEGRSVDTRSDVWALGCILYEMATGERPFRAETQASLIGAIMQTNPEPPSKKRPQLPERLDRAICRCLEKDPDRRWPGVPELARELRKVKEGDNAEETERLRSAPRRSRTARLVTATLAVLAVLAGTLWLTMRPGEAPVEVSRLSINPAPGESWVISPHAPDFAIASDGERIAYIGRRGEDTQLVVRRLNEFEGVPLGTFGGAIRYPFFSPDGEWVGFVDGNVLKKAAVDGSAAVTVCALPGYLSGASWGADDTIVLGTLNHGLYRVPSAGGDLEPIETRAMSEGRTARWPHILPGGRAVLFASASRRDSEVRVRSLSGDDESVLVAGATFPQYVRTGHLLYVAEGVLWAVGFDAARLELFGDPIPVVDGVMVKGLPPTGLGAANVGISENGTLVFRPTTAGGETSALVWVDRNGHEEPLDLDPRDYGRPRIAPDGSRIAVEVTDAIQSNTDIWVGNPGGSALTQLSFDPGLDSYPTWSPDGERVAFASERDGGSIVWKRADGTGSVEHLVSASRVQVDFVTPDGSELVYLRVAERAFFGVSLQGDGLEERRLELEYGPVSAISPDGRWFAHSSEETGDFEIYVQPFPNPDGAKWRITFGGGRDAVWSRNGEELFFQNDTTMFAVAVQTEPTFSAGQPVALFEGPYIDAFGRWYDVAPDGRFLMVKPGWLSDRATPVMHVVLNWFEELRRVVPTEN